MENRFELNFSRNKDGRVMRYEEDRNTVYSEGLGGLIMRDQSCYVFTMVDLSGEDCNLTLLGKSISQNKGKIKMVINAGSQCVEERVLMLKNGVLKEKIEISGAFFSKTGSTRIEIWIFIEEEDEFICLKSLELVMEPIVHRQLINWMKELPDQRFISGVSIPGTHDCAAISYMHTAYACHLRSITGQLENGIRLFDIRLSIRKSDEEVILKTCHSSLGQRFRWNEYEDFQTVMEQFEAFLSANPTEFLIATLKIDSLNVEKEEAAEALDQFLSRWSLPFVKDMKGMKVGEARGKLILFSRIEEGLGEIKKGTRIYDFGIPLLWESNKYEVQHLERTGRRRLDVMVQDFYMTTHASKEEIAIKAVEACKDMKEDAICLNYLSACYIVTLGMMGINIKSDILAYLAKEPRERRTAKLGWMLMDFEEESELMEAYGPVHLTDFIIDSNFGYSYYQKKFRRSRKVIEEARNEL